MLLCPFLEGQCKYTTYTQISKIFLRKKDFDICI